MRRFFNSISLFVTMTSILTLVSAAISAKEPVVRRKLPPVARKQLVAVSPKNAVNRTPQRQKPITVLRSGAAAPSTRAASITLEAPGEHVVIRGSGNGVNDTVHATSPALP
jgi:hypothetical protein